MPDAYTSIIEEARAEIAAGRVPNAHALQARIRAAGGDERALARLERVLSVQRARARLSREVAPVAKPSLRSALKTKPTINANMDVRRDGSSALVWDAVKAVVEWEVRVSARADARSEYVVREQRVQAETRLELDFGEATLRVHILGRARDGRLVRRAVISGLSRAGWG